MAQSLDETKQQATKANYHTASTDPDFDRIIELANRRVGLDVRMATGPLAYAIENWVAIENVFASGNTKLVLGDAVHNVARYNRQTYQHLLPVGFQNAVATRRKVVRQFLSTLSPQTVQNCTIHSCMPVNHPVFGFTKVVRMLMPLTTDATSMPLFGLACYCLMPKMSMEMPDSSSLLSVSYTDNDGVWQMMDLRPHIERELVHGITAREQEVLVLIARGLTNKEIAVRLNMATATVQRHRQNMMMKFGCNNVAELIHTATLRRLV
jgi:DNA-binding CsgD family transcriptional regulator